MTSRKLQHPQASSRPARRRLLALYGLRQWEQDHRRILPPSLSQDCQGRKAPIGPMLPPPIAVPMGTPLVPVGPSVTPNVEQRLQRLEAATNQILRELRSLRSQNREANRDYIVRSRARAQNDEANNATTDQAKLRLLDEQIKAVAAQIKGMQARMAKLQAERASIAPRRSMDVVPSDASLPENVRDEMPVRVSPSNDAGVRRDYGLKPAEVAPSADAVPQANPDLPR